MKPKTKSKTPKIPVVRVSADDCVINVGQVVEDGEITVAGKPYYVHQNEWVELMPVMTIREVMNLSRLQQGADEAGGLNNNLRDLCVELSKRVVGWNWTDMMGEDLPSPYNSPDVLEGLTSEELLWLVSAATDQETGDERKKDSEQLANTS